MAEKTEQTKKVEKWMVYSYLIQGAIAQIFNDDSDYFIDLKELSEDDNMTHFTHALLNAVPTSLLNKLTDSSNTQIETNHIANILCYQFSSNAINSCDEQKT